MNSAPVEATAAKLQQHLGAAPTSINSSWAPSETRVEVVPLAPVELVPREFQMITKDVRGRVLYEGRDGQGVADSHAAIIPLVGSWGSDARVAFTDHAQTFWLNAPGARD